VLGARDLNCAINLMLNYYRFMHNRNLPDLDGKSWGMFWMNLEAAENAS
jgi:predicted lactoylglutathione lyase